MGRPCLPFVTNSLSGFDTFHLTCLVYCSALVRVLSPTRLAAVLSWGCLFGSLESALLDDPLDHIGTFRSYLHHT
jgi:hypothetical protein